MSRQPTQTTRFSTSNMQSSFVVGSPFTVFGDSSREPLSDKTGFILNQPRNTFVSDNSNIARPTILQQPHTGQQNAVPTELLAVAASEKKRSWSESSSPDGSASKN